jgi:signal transduction histidine kinase
MRMAYERSLEIVRLAHERAEAAVERAARMREALRRARSYVAESGAPSGAKTETLLQFAAEENARVIEEKERFIAVVSHELRQPLNAALAAAQLIEMDPSGEPAERAGAVIRRQLRIMAALLEDFAEMSRLRLRPSDLRLETVDLADVVSAAAESVESRVAETGLALRLRIPGGLFVEGDRARLYQLFANLLSNAVRYTTPPGRIEATAATNNGQAVVTVSDTGQGIAAEHLPHIFEPFARGGERGGEGLGIGLALVRSIAERHGGSAEAASDGLGHGSAFTIRLPLATAKVPLPQSNRDSRG